MRHDLKDYDLPVITEAFERYRQGNKKIPTCHCMRELCKAVAAEKRRDAEPYVPARTKPRPFVADWYEGKFWAQFEDYERNQFVEDIKNFTPVLRRSMCIAYHAPEILATITTEQPRISTETMVA
jgi:hypothetical protein